MCCHLSAKAALVTLFMHVQFVDSKISREVLAIQPQDPRLSGLVFTEHLLSQFTAGSVGTCAVKCSHGNGRVSFTFNSQQTG